MSTLALMRTDHVGSLLRPSALSEVRRCRDAGNCDADELRAAEDTAIAAAITMQEAVGLHVATDGEFRRLNFQDSFGSSVEGFAAGNGTLQAMEEAAEGSKPLRRFEKKPDRGGPVVMSHRAGLHSRLQMVRNTPLEEFTFLQQLATVTPKITLVGPDRIAQRVALESSTEIYADADELVADVVAIEGEMVGQLVEAGCRYIQIDAPGYTAYVDEPSLAAMAARGEDPEETLARSIHADNQLLDCFGDATSAIHLCRGNNRSMWHREGHYDAIAEQLFSSLGHERILLEYDSDRSGSFEPLRFVPKGKVVVLGLVSTKTPELETVEQLTRRIDEASRYLPLEQLALSPQCGFASSAIGNVISEVDQRRKLEVVVETAQAVWGDERAPEN